MFANDSTVSTSGAPSLSVISETNDGIPQPIQIVHLMHEPQSPKDVNACLWRLTIS
jgi:hypothetical protein